MIIVFVDVQNLPAWHNSITRNYKIRGMFSKNCASCKNNPKLCDKCEDFYFVSESNECKSCPKGCVNCKNESTCLECTSTRSLSDNDLCKLKLWIWIAIIGSIVALILIGGTLLIVFDRKARKKEKMLKEQLIEKKKNFLLRGRDN